MAKLKFKKNFRNFLAIALAILVGAGVILGFVKIGEKLTSKTKEISPSYQIGGIDVSGKGTSATDSIVTKEAFACQGLKITPEFASNIQYQVFFYGVDDMYLECSEVTSETYNYCPTLASHARVVIYPQPDEDDDDVKVKWYQVRSYAKQLTIEVNRKQNSKSFSDNLYVSLGVGEFVDGGIVDPNGNYYCGEANVSEYDKVVLKLKLSDMEHPNYNPPITWLALVYEDTTKFAEEFLFNENVISKDSEFITYLVDTTGANSLKIMTLANSFTPQICGVLI